MRSNLLLLLLIATPAISTGASTYKENGDFEIRNAIEYSDVLRLEEFINAGKSIKRVVFIDVLGTKGGAKQVFDKLIPIIRNSSLSTVVAGECFSSCALAFIAGTSKTFLRQTASYPTALLFHPFRTVSSGKVIEPYTSLAIQQIRQDLRGVVPEAYLAKLNTIENPKGGIYIFGKPVETISKSTYSVFCTGNESRIPWQCEPIPEITIDKLGIVNYTDSWLRSFLAR